MFVYGCRHATCSSAIWRMFSFTSFIIGSTHRPSTSQLWSHQILVDNDKITNLTSPAAKSNSAGYMFCFCFVFFYVFLTIPVRGIVSKSAVQMFTKFSGLVELWL